MFFIIGILLATFLKLLLLIKKNKSRADKILVIWLFLIALHLGFYYFISTGAIYNYPHLLGIQFPMPVLQGVLLYFYAMELTGNKLNKRWAVLLHLLPAASLVILAIPFYILPPNEKVYVFQNDGAGFEWYILYEEIIIPLSGLLYSVWTLLLIKKHRLNIRDRFSNTDKKELQWLKILSIGCIIIWINVIFFDEKIIFTTVVLLVLFIGFFGINQLNLFYTNQEINIKNVDKETIKIKIETSNKRYAKSGLNENKASEIYAKLKGSMEDNSFYKNEELTIAELSKHLEVHPNHLSQVINEMEGKNFYNYINSLRIYEFIKLASLPENKKFTIISLAHDCGFSSKSTFNKHFKLNTGKTPTDFFNS